LLQVVQAVELLHAWQLAGQLKVQVLEAVLSVYPVAQVSQIEVFVVLQAAQLGTLQMKHALLLFDG
jgi:hypothetical protein